jgi:hypothetical protein
MLDKLGYTGYFCVCFDARCSKEPAIIEEYKILIWSFIQPLSCSLELMTDIYSILF